jgi:hypothetical protein
MGVIKRIILNKEVPTPQFNTRLTVELCENVHLHYRNLRLEFTAEEFLDIVAEIKSIKEDEVKNFAYGPDKFKALVAKEILPPQTEFNNRLQIEEQQGGRYHVHYRNLRIELEELSEIGITKN